MEINGITITYISELPVWREGRQEINQVITCPAPLTAAQLAALGDGTGWTVTEGEETRRIEGMDTLTQVRYTFARSVSELAAAQAQAAAQAAALEQVLQDARAGLVAAPVAGEAWDSAKWYRTGDTVTHEGVGYTCAKTCKGREPGVGSLIAYWEATPTEDPPQVLAWGEIANGETIPVGQLVSHNGSTWRCIQDHSKSIIRQPSAVQTEYWEAQEG